jgi:glycolate oxidase FAD binding subunit
MHVAQAPATREELCSALARAAEAGTPVRLRGAGTKQTWPPPAPADAVEISTAGLDELIEHNAGDLTAVLEPGVTLARAQETFAKAGQMLALDPPDGGATIGGVVASGDTGPLRGRYGGPRDLVVGMRVALSDGTLAKSGGTVIKNVAGYDIAKLFTGSFGTLGAIVEMSVRLHPLPPQTSTAIGTAGDAAELARGAVALAGSALEHQALDIRWEAGRGKLLARFGGAAPRPQAEAAAALLREEGIANDIDDDDDQIWADQRAGQRGPLVVKVSGLPTRLPELLRTADELGALVVGRAALGLSWLSFEEASAAPVERLRSDWIAVVQDRPADLDVDPWGRIDPAKLELMRRVKERFDPAGVCV